MPRRKVKKASSAHKSLSNEVAAVLVIIVSAFLLVSLLATELTGHVGRFSNALLVGVLGRNGAVATMIWTFVAGVIALSGRKKTARKIHFFMLLMVIAVLLASALAVPAIRREWPYRDLGTDGGGMVGGILGSVVVSLVGEIGAWVVVVTALLLGLLWVTNTSLVSVVRRMLSLLKAAVLFVRKQRRPAGRTKAAALPPTPPKMTTVVEEEEPRLEAGPCLLYTSPSPRDGATSRMPSSA